MDRKDRKNIRFQYCLLFLLLFVACVKDKPATPDNLVVTDTTNNVYVVCEGSLGNGNSSLSLYNIESGIIQEDVYQPANGQALGDVFQSMIRINGQLFLCINNSDKILVIDPVTHKLTTTISVPKPRYILPVSDTKAYVSTLFSNKVYIINPQTFAVTGSIEMPYLNPEGMLLYSGKVYVCPWDTANEQVYQINTTTDKIEGTVKLEGRAPQEMVVDKENKIWVLSGNVARNKVAMLTRFDPTSNRVISAFTFPVKADPIRPVINNTGDMIYFIEVNYDGGTDNNGIYRMGINDATLPSQAFVAAKQLQYFWGLGIHPTSGKVFVADPKGFIQKGTAYIYNADGSLSTSFSTGVGPGHFYFD